MTTVEKLAGELAVQPGDVKVVMRTLGTVELSDEVAAEVRLVLNPHAERTIPASYGATGAEV